MNYSLDGTPGTIPAPKGFNLCMSAGPVGVDTHAFEFTYRPNISLSTISSYTVYADRGARGDNTSDYLTGTDRSGSFYVGPDSIKPVTVSCNLAAAPLPPAFSAGLAMLALMAVVGVVRWSAIKA